VREHPAERRRERERPVGELKLGVAFCHLPPREQQPLIYYSKVPWYYSRRTYCHIRHEQLVRDLARVRLPGRNVGRGARGDAEGLARW